MNLAEVVKNLGEQIRGETIESYESMLSKNVEELSKNEDFFKFPLNNIFSVISKVDFNEIEENDKRIETIQNIINNTIKFHSEEKESILVLQNLDITTFSLTFEELFSFLEQITNCSIISNFCNLYKEHKELPTKDYEFELQQKEKEIQSFQRERNIILDLNKDGYDRDILRACVKGKFANVIWLIEYENVDKYTKDELGDTLLHLAVRYVQVPIVRYLVERLNFDINIGNNKGRTPLHFAVENNDIKTINFLLSKGANIEAEDNQGWTPLYLASFTYKKEAYQFLAYKGANRNVKPKDPIPFSSFEEQAAIVRTLKRYE